MSKGGQGGGKGSTTTVQKADPWSGLQPALSSLYGSANQWYQGAGPQYYPNSTVAPTNDNIQGALNMGATTAGAGPNPLVGQGQQEMSDTINGKYLTPGSNPFLQGQYESATRPLVSQFQNSIAPAIGSQFSAAGRTGSGAHAAAFGQATDALGHALSDTASNMYGNAYNNERGLQQSASLAAPAFASSAQNMDFDRAAKMMGVGQYQQSQAQDLINADKERYDYGQNLPLSKLQSLNQLLQGGSAYNSTSGTSNQNSSMNRNPFAGAIGGTAMGGVLGPMLGATGPMGALGGALLGGLFG